MDKLLDKVVHPSYKAPSLVTYLTPRHVSCHAPVASSSSSNRDNHGERRTPWEAGGACGGGRQASRQTEAQQNEATRSEPGPASATGTNSATTRPKTTLSYTLTYGQRCVHL